MIFDYKKLSIIFTVIILFVVYVIIFTALKIMNKDIKSSGRKKTTRKSLGFEVIEAGQNSNLRKSSVIPLYRGLTLGRKSDNMLILSDEFVSGYHARVYIKNNDYIIEDLKSTNGTMVNSEKINNKAYLKIGDEIRVGSSIFKVIG